MNFKKIIPIAFLSLGVFSIGANSAETSMNKHYLSFYAENNSYNIQLAKKGDGDHKNNNHHNHRYHNEAIVPLLMFDSIINNDRRYRSSSQCKIRIRGETYYGYYNRHGECVLERRHDW